MTTEQHFEFFCVLSTGEESILAVIPGSGETEAERLRGAEREAVARDLWRGHGPVQVRGARMMPTDEERDRLVAARDDARFARDRLRLEIAIREALAHGVVCHGDQSVADALHCLLDSRNETATPDDWTEIMREISPRLRFANHITAWDPSRGRRQTVSRQAYLTATT